MRNADGGSTVSLISASEGLMHDSTCTRPRCSPNTLQRGSPVELLKRGLSPDQPRAISFPMPQLAPARRAISPSYSVRRCTSFRSNESFQRTTVRHPHTIRRFTRGSSLEPGSVCAQYWNIYPFHQSVHQEHRDSRTAGESSKTCRKPLPLSSSPGMETTVLMGTPSHTGPSRA